MKDDDDDEQCILFGRFSGIALLPRSSDNLALFSFTRPALPYLLQGALQINLRHRRCSESEPSR